jgi:hypothetical protein
MIFGIILESEEHLCCELNWTLLMEGFLANISARMTRSPDWVAALSGVGSLVPSIPQWCRFILHVRW